jgi:hypothetical protein
LRPGEGLQEHETWMRKAPLVIERRLPVTSEPLLPAGRVREAEAETVADAERPPLRAPGGREAREGGEPPSPAFGQEAALSPHAIPRATSRATPLRTTKELPPLHAHRTASVPSRAALQRPLQSVDAPRRAQTPRAQRHDPTQPLAQRGLAMSPHIPTRADRVAHDTSDALEYPIAPRQAQRFQDHRPLGAVPSPQGATQTHSNGQALGAPATTPPRLPLSPPLEVPEQPAALPQSPEPPPPAATRPAPRVPTTAAVMARPVPTPSVRGRTIEIHTELAQTSVLINGAYLGPTPVVIHLPLGVYTMAIDRPGYPQMRWKMQVDPTGVALLMTKSGGGSWPPAYTPRVFAH